MVGSNGTDRNQFATKKHLVIVSDKEPYLHRLRKIPQYGLIHQGLLVSVNIQYKGITTIFSKKGNTQATPK